MYKTIPNRNPDSTGKANWLGKLEDGVSRKGVYAGFANSDEPKTMYFRQLMVMAKNRIITVQNVSIAVSAEEVDDYICITDIADAKSDRSRAADIIRNS